MDSRGQTDRAGVRGDGKPRPLSGGAYDGTYREGAFCANVGGTAGLQSCPMKAQAFVEQGFFVTLKGECTMNQTLRKIICIGLALLSLASLAACGSGDDAASAQTYSVGIVQFMDHPSLNQITDNIKSELAAKRK